MMGFRRRRILVRTLLVWVFLCGGLAFSPAARAQVPQGSVTTRAEALRLAGTPERALLLLGQGLRFGPGTSQIRAELLRCVADLGGPARAEAWLRYLLSQDPKPSRRAGYLAALHALDRARPLRLTGGLALLPSTNIDRTSSESTFDTEIGTFRITNGGQEKSGLGLRMSARAEAHLPSVGPDLWRLQAQLATGWYEDAALRYVEPRVALSWSRTGFPRQWSAQAYASHRAYPEPGDVVTSERDVLGLAGRMQITRPDRAYWAFDLQVERRDYRFKSYLDGPYVALRGSYGRPLGGQGGRGQVLAVLDRSLTATAHNAYLGLALLGRYTRNLGDGLRGGLSAGLTWRSYDGRFPALTRARADRAYSLGVSLSPRRFTLFGASPELSCVAQRTLSNVALYTFDAVDCALDFSYNF